MTDKQLLKALGQHVSETRGQYGAVTEACKVTESTVRRWIKDERLPENALVREALERFLSKPAQAEVQK